MALGHEGVGIVDAVGEKVTDFEVYGLPSSSLESTVSHLSLAASRQPSPNLLTTTQPAVVTAQASTSSTAAAATARTVYEAYTGSGE